ncbi:MAG: ABC transporter ATP-binding protein [Clostridia bacterium]|nr:ABC transporter ATP-binding protein [Clostridia bacterium]MBP3503396.1 ABC transporter ATP-binding protein [Clostridia bacterium]
MPKGPGGPGGKMGAGEKAKDAKGTLAKLFKMYLKQYKWKLIIVFIFAVASTIFTIVGPKILGKATTEIYNGIVKKISGIGGIDFNYILHIILILVGLYVISALCSLVQGLIMTDISQKLTYKMRDDLSKKIHKLPMNFFDKKNKGEVLSILTNDIDTFGQSFNQSITEIITAICTIIGILVMMFSINVTMTFISLLILPISAFLLKKIVGKSQKYFKAQQDILGNVNGQVEEVYGGQLIVKAFNKEDDVLEEFKKNNEKLFSAGWKSQFMGGFMHPVMNFISNLGYVAVAIVGGYFTIQGKIQVGDIQSFIQYNKQFTQPIGQVAQVMTQIQTMIAAVERVLDFLEEKEEKDSEKNPVDVKTLKGNIEFNHVKFGYNPDKIVIKDFNAKVKDGQKIAIVGPTGAGKTTLVKLLMRFYDLNSGNITIDGYDIKDFKKGDLRQHFGMVLQDTWLFGGTIKDNIKYSRPDATDDEVIEAAKAANIHHFIKTLPGGYDNLLNEETNNISAGQKQLLTIARVILADPEILILDEATSSIDTRTEIQIQAAMDNLMKGRTSFIIAHRLSTIKNADMILVINDGDIVEQGKHEELLAKGGFYATLYNSQFDEEEE